MRQKIKDATAVKQYVEINQSMFTNGLIKLSEGGVNQEMLCWYKKGLVSNLLYLTIAEYTLGSDFKCILEKYKRVLNYIDIGWGEKISNLNQNGEIYCQYTLSNYDEMLWMLSLGFLLDISNENFNKLVEIIDGDGVKDVLFEFIIRAKLKDRLPIEEESYRKYFGIPNCFKKLRQAITILNKSQAEILVKEFITKDWYKNHKDAGWHNSHKSFHNTYFGYWSFETAAIVKIMGLDDNSFRDCKYYPNDLVKYDFE